MRVMMLMRYQNHTRTHNSRVPVSFQFAVTVAFVVVQRPLLWLVVLLSCHKDREQEKNPHASQNPALVFRVASTYHHDGFVCMLQNRTTLQRPSKDATPCCEQARSSSIPVGLKILNLDVRAELQVEPFWGLL